MDIFRNFRNRSWQSVCSSYRTDVSGMWLLSVSQRQAHQEPRITGVLLQGRLPELTAGYMNTLKGHPGKAVCTFQVKISNMESDIAGSCHPSLKSQLLQRSRQGIHKVKTYLYYKGGLKQLGWVSQSLSQNKTWTDRWVKNADHLWNTFQDTKV